MYMHMCMKFLVLLRSQPNRALISKGKIHKCTFSCTCTCPVLPWGDQPPHQSKRSWTPWLSWHCHSHHDGIRTAGGERYMKFWQFRENNRHVPSLTYTPLIVCVYTTKNEKFLLSNFNSRGKIRIFGRVLPDRMNAPTDARISSEQSDLISVTTYV